jgi:hypothetical protein
MSSPTKTLQQVFEENGSKFPFMVDFKGRNFNPFIVHGITKKKEFICEDKDGSLSIGWGGKAEATLHTPPKPKVKLYKYAFRRISIWIESGQYYKDDADFLSAVSAKAFLRLDKTMIEVDDE